MYDAQALASSIKCVEEKMSNNVKQHKCRRINVADRKGTGTGRRV